MKRVGLKQEFHGEPDMDQEGLEAASDKDEVTVEIPHGTISYRVPTNTPDNRVIGEEYLSGFMDLELTLENGQVLALRISEDAQGVDARLLDPDVPQTG